MLGWVDGELEEEKVEVGEEFAQGFRPMEELVGGVDRP